MATLTNHHKHLHIMVILKIILSLSLQAQETKTAPQLPPKMIAFEHLTVNDGLSNPQVMGIVQDKQGFMWFATANGLNKYDGYNFTNYLVNPDNPDDPGTVSAEVVVDVIVDHTGSLWVTTFGGGVSRYDHQTDRFTHYKHDPDDAHSISDNVLNWIVEDKNGELWIGVAKKGLNRYDRENDRFIRYHHDPGDPDSIGNNVLFDVFEDSQGRIWVGLIDSIDRCDRENNRFIHYTHEPGDPYSLPNAQRWTIGEDSSGNIWAGSRNGGGVVRYDEKNGQFIRYAHDPDDPGSIADNNIWSINKDSHGTLWVGTLGNGVDVYDPNNDRFIHYQHDPNTSSSIIHNSICQVYEDRSGVLWFSTFGGGISRYDRKTERFSLMRNDPADQNSLSENNVYGMLEDSLGNLWIGTFSSGLNKYDSATDQVSHYEHNPADPNSISDNTVFWITEDDAGILWIGTRSGGLNRYDPATEQFTHYKNNPDNPASITNNECHNVLYAGNNELWISHGTSVSKFDMEQEIFTQYPNVGHYNTIMFQDSIGDIWVGGGLGVFRYDRVQDQFEKEAITKDVIHAMVEDEEDNFWLGWGGIRKFDRKQGTFTEHYDTDDGLIDNSVTGILPDGIGNFWIATTKGLSYFNIAKQTFKNYEVGTFNLKSYYQSPGGRLFFGGTHGVTHFLPEDIVDNPHKPPVVLTSFKKLNEEVALETPIPYLKELRLTHQDRFFAFEFAALDYSSPYKNQYKYMLEGFDQEWINVNATRRFAGYTNLGEGMYRFRVQGSNNDGVWNEEGAQLNMYIEPDPTLTSPIFRLTDLLGNEIILPYHDNSLSLEIAPLDYALLDQERTYMLEGYDTDWIDAENRRYVHYTHLTPGRYVFKTRGSITHEIPIRITPPFWQTWWFYTLVGVFFAGWAGFIYSQQISRLKAQNKAKLLGKEMELARQIQTAILPRTVRHEELDIESTIELLRNKANSPKSARSR